MSLFKAYFKPFDLEGNYLSEFTEISKDVLKISNVSQNLDSTEYNVGVFRSSAVKLSLRNDHGKYLDQTSAKTIFDFQREDVIFKIDWFPYLVQPLCGFAVCGSSGLSTATLSFDGLLKDISSTSNIENQEISFNVLGYESLFKKETVPYSSINNGDNVSDVILACLNQEMITSLLTVDVSNITLSTDQTIDDKSSLENKTVDEALEELLRISNSVLYIENQTVFVTDRTESASVQYRFFGPSSIGGNQNIVNIKNYRDGTNRLFNYWTWDNSNLVQLSATSVVANGVRKNSVSSDLITDSTKRNTILTNYVNEFSEKKIELMLETPANTDTIGLQLLDKVTINYPNVYVSSDQNEIPRYGQAVYGQARLPYGQFSLTIREDIEFKIIAKTINLNNSTLMFTLREV